MRVNVVESWMVPLTPFAVAVMVTGPPAVRTESTPELAMRTTELSLLPHATVRFVQLVCVMFAVSAEVAPTVSPATFPVTLTAVTAHGGVLGVVGVVGVEGVEMEVGALVELLEHDTLAPAHSTAKSRRDISGIRRRGTGDSNKVRARRAPLQTGNEPHATRVTPRRP